jgi:hypothetical protein
LFGRRRRAVSGGALLAGSPIAFEGLALVTIAPEVAGNLGFGGRIGPPVPAKHPRPAEPALYGRVCGESACVSCTRSDQTPTGMW